jgi:hypothetical protein
LEAVLRGIEERVPREHDEWCIVGEGRHSEMCDARWSLRVRAEQARAVERMVIAAAQTFHGATFDNQMAWQDDENAPQSDAMSMAWAAALRAGEEHQ